MKTGVVRVAARAVGAAAVTVVLGALACEERKPTPNAPTPNPPGPVVPVDAVLVGAGDIGWCGSLGHAETARLLDALPGTIFTTGDNAYMSGTAAQFRDCYDPTWGRHRRRTRPSPGNHDYETAGAAPYFAYFGENAGPDGVGYYSYDLGAWHVLSLNSVAPARSGSAQESWVRADLAANRRQCTVAYWHAALFSSGENGNQAEMRDMWRTLQEFGVDVVLAGHDHGYERFGPQDATGRPDPQRGIRQFVVGTGGAPLYNYGPPKPNSEAQASAWGVLKLTLRSDAYDWEFIAVPGANFRDAGTAPCQ